MSVSGETFKSGSVARSTPSARVELVVGDIVTAPADAIVTAVGSGSEGTSLVQLALRRAAGPELAHAYDHAIAELPGSRLRAGEAVATPGFALPCRHVIHCQPLDFRTHPAGAQLVLERCLRRAFEHVHAYGLETVAIPALGTGAYGFPVDLAARTAIRAVREAAWKDRSPVVRFVLYGPATLEAYASALRDSTR